MKTVIYHYMEYGEFEKIVKGYYGIDYDYVADEELNNDSSKEYNDMTVKGLDKWDTEKLNKFKSGDKKVQYMGRTLLQDLINNSILPEGNYLIDISW